VKIEQLAVVNTSWKTGQGPLRHVRDAMQTQGVSLVDSRQNKDELPRAIVYRYGAGGFVEE